MNCEQKKAYRAFLESCVVKQGDEPRAAEMAARLQEKSREMVPDVLCRYRPPSEYAFLDLEKELVTFTHPAAFDDLNDSFPNYSLTGLNDVIESIDNPKTMRVLYESTDFGKLARTLSEMGVKGAEERISELESMSFEEKRQCLLGAAFTARGLAQTEVIPALQGSCRNDYRVMCLTRSSQDEKMWTDYADNHTGFVVVFNSEDIRHCNMYLGCDMGVLLLPVLYDDTPFDADKQSQWGMLSGMGFNIANEDILSNFKAIYRKRTDFEWEDEFRAVLMPSSEEEKQCYVQRTCRPLRVILGNCMRGADRDRCIGAANNLGINWCDE